MKITDLKVAMIGSYATLRIVTDKGIDGYSQIEAPKTHVMVNVPYFRELILGSDPTDVESVMLRIRRAGAFKPWGKIVSSIEMALWDIAGKEAGVPVYKLLGGKVRDKVRVYNGSYRLKNPPHEVDDTPEKRGETILALNEEVGFTIVKTAIGWHAPQHFPSMVGPDFAYNSYPPLAAGPSTQEPGSRLTEPR